MADEPIVVSFFLNELQRRHAEILKESLTGLGMPFEVDDFSTSGIASRAEFIRRKMDQHKDRSILYLEAGGLVHSRPELLLDPQEEFDMAVYVHTAWPTKRSDRTKFDGVGWIFPMTLLFRPTMAAQRVLDRWADVNMARVDRREQDNLLFFLAEEQVRFFYLPPGYAWVESAMRKMYPDDIPVIEYPSLAVLPENLSAAGGGVAGSSLSKKRPTEVLWSGHLYDQSGYAKLNRELLFRVANSVRVSVFQEDLGREQVLVDPSTLVRLEAHKRIQVSPNAPLLRVYTPRKETQKRHRICYTMMESQEIHPDFAGMLEANYDEVWTPTEWNRRGFQAAGLRKPCYAIPLGVNLQVFRRLDTRPARPRAELISTSRAGTKESPPGFAFLCVFQPTFRKGIDFLVWAFEVAFRGDPDVSLVLATSVHRDLSPANPFGLAGGNPKSIGAKVYHLTGRWDEEEMAGLYNSFDAYVSASRGEGYDLPLQEAYACGLPVIASDCSSHSEILNSKNAFLFSPEGFEPVEGAKHVCPWYDGQPFARFGKSSLDQLVAHFRAVRAGAKAQNPPESSLDWLTWDSAAAKVVARLQEIQEVPPS